MRIDLRSDTVTRPTSAMKTAMVEAPLGDDVYEDDPTVKALEEEAARLSGKEAALFVPSGTMANQIAIRLHTRSGDAVLMYEGSHPYNWEAAGAAVISGVQIRPYPGHRGRVDPERVRSSVRPVDPHVAPTTLLCVEDTCNRGGGTVYPLSDLDEVCEVARSVGLGVHMDGARAFNAVVASGVPLARRAQGCDTVMFCLSKGLGAPVGSMLCGPAAWMTRARRIRKMLGGGMRQAGVLAGAGLYALTHHVERLADDHRRARRLAEGLTCLGFSADPGDTNMVYVDGLADAPALVARLREAELLCNAVGPKTLRLVTHLDVDDEAVAGALEVFAAVGLP